MLFLPKTIEHERLTELCLTEDNLHYEASYLASKLGYVLSIELNEMNDPDYMNALDKAADFIDDTAGGWDYYDEIKVYANDCVKDIQNSFGFIDDWDPEAIKDPENEISSCVCLERVQMNADGTGEMDWHDVCVKLNKNKRIESMQMKPWFFL